MSDQKLSLEKKKNHQNNEISTKSKHNSIIPFFKSVFHVVYYASVIFFIAFSALFLTLKLLVLPNLHDYRDEIAQIIYEKSHVKMKIGKINTNWDGLNPHLQFDHIQIYNKNNEIALDLSIQSNLEWVHLLGGNILFDLINLKNTHLLIERDAKGQLYIAGIPLTSEKSDSSLGDWLITQPKIYIENATIIWRDSLKKKPDLALSRVNFLLKNDIYQNKHEVGFNANAPHEFGGQIDVRGQLQGSKLDLIHLWESDYYFGIQAQDLSAVHKYFDVPFELSQGGGKLKVWVSGELGKLKNISAQFNLFDINAKLDNHSPSLALQYVKGNIDLNRTEHSKYIFKATNITALTQQDFLLPKSNITSILHLDDDKKLKIDSLEADIPEIDLSNLLTLSKALPLEYQTKLMVEKTNPQGLVKNVNLSWQNNYPKKHHFKLTGEFFNLTSNGYNKIPAITNLSGVIDASQLGGTISLYNGNQKPLILNIPEYFEQPIKLDGFKTKFSWNYDLNHNLEFKISELQAFNAYASAFGNISYKAFKDTLGYLDLSIGFNKLNAKYVYQYLPKIINSEVRNWVKNAILDGESKDTRITIKGNLNDYPFVDSKKGLFEIYSKLSNGKLQFLNTWQPIEKMKADILFRGTRMDIFTEEGLLNNAKIGKTQIYIPDLSLQNNELYIKGVVNGQTSDFLSYIVKNPINNMINHATQNFSASGLGKLDLDLKIPLSEPEKTTVKGFYNFYDNKLSLNKELPIFHNLFGAVEFSEKFVKGNQLKTTVYNSPTSASFLHQNDILSINFNSNLDSSTFFNQQNFVNLDSQTRNNLSKIIVGRSPWIGSVNLNTKNNDLKLNLSSNLNGTAINLPLPIKKASNQIQPITIEQKALNTNSDQLLINLDNLAKAQIILNSKSNNIEKSLITLGKVDNKTNLGNGLVVVANTPKINLDEWQNFYTLFNNKNNKKSDNLTFNADIKTDSLELNHKKLNHVGLQIKGINDQTSLNLASDEANGTVKINNDKTILRLKNLIISPEMLVKYPSGSMISTQNRLVPQDIPNLDISIDSFEVSNKKLGKLDILATSKGKELSFDKINLNNPDSNFKATGIWQNYQGQYNITKLNFDLDTYDGGKLLKRLNKNGVLKHTSAKIKGLASWKGTPSDFSFPLINGQFTLEAKEGQFLKADPGITKLLSVLSLQSIPKRITLDFKDVFSEGFAFDEMIGKFQMDKGVLNISDFRMIGSLAGVTMKGKVNLNNDTQNLNVKIVPKTLGDSISIASSFLGGPITGITTMIVQKVLKNPLDKLTAYNLSVTGSLEDPKVEKQGLSIINSENNN